MFSKLKYRFQINKLNKKIEKVDREYKKIIRNEENKEKKDELIAEHHSQVVPIQCDIQYSMSRHLKAEANKLMLPLPDFNDKEMWEEDYFYRTSYVLTNKGLSVVRAQIRKEKKERKDQYLPWLALLIGLIGALAALISIIKN